MGQNTEELTTTAHDIETTRDHLSRDIDELSDKVSPHRVMQRRKESAKDRIGSVRHKLMGSASSVKHNVSSSGDSMSSSAEGAVDTVTAKAEGNPLAAGLVAFGAGMLVSALIPASDKEAHAARQVVETAKEKGLADEAKSVGHEMGSHLKDSATEAAQEVKATAQESADHLKQEGRSSVEDVRDQAKP